MASECKYPFHEALAKLESFCAYQERCRSELRKKMLEWGMVENDISEALDHLKKNRYFDDERYCESYISGKVRIKKWGRNRIRFELKNKGFKDEQIRPFLEAIDDEIYFENLNGLASRKWLESKGDHYNRKAKVFRFLASKGYESDLIQDVLGKIAEEGASTTD